MVRLPTPAPDRIWTGPAQTGPRQDVPYPLPRPNWGRGGGPLVKVSTPSHPLSHSPPPRTDPAQTGCTLPPPPPAQTGPWTGCTLPATPPVDRITHTRVTIILGRPELLWNSLEDISDIHKFPTMPTCCSLAVGKSVNMLAILGYTEKFQCSSTLLNIKYSYTLLF